MTIISLVKSAFGPKATLYTPLDCTKTSTQSELRSAYRKAALRFHPDRANANTNDGINSYDGDTSTLKFQAVSAAYQVLMDEKQRAIYDATGRIMEEYNDDYASSDNDNEGNQQQAPRRNRKRPGNQNQQQWEDFFHSIFNEIISTGNQHENHALSYSGSVQENTDVLKYYTMCKGNMQKVLECIVHATQEDIRRWRKDIIDPAICRGEVDNFFNDDVDATTEVNAKKKYAMKLEDSSSSEDDVIVSNIAKKKYAKKMKLEDSSSSEDDAISTTRSFSKLKRLKSRKDIAKKTSCLLVDTDDELEEERSQQKTTTKSAANMMSMRDKMDYRVAKKRKLKAEKEMEIAKIVQSKNWDGGINHFQNSPANRGVVSDQFLSQIERKYATKSSSKRRRKR